MLLKIIFCILVIIFNFVTKGNSKIIPIVQTDSGIVVGTREKTVLNYIPYDSYRGIPYVEPILTKEQRFQPSKPVRPWKDPLFATADKPRCLTFENEQVVGSEDCLYLNIYVPKKELITEVHQLTKEWDESKARIYGKAIILKEHEKAKEKHSLLQHRRMMDLTRFVEVSKRQGSKELNGTWAQKVGKAIFLRQYGSAINLERSKRKERYEMQAIIAESKKPLKPVLVWIHGGAFMRGNGNSSFYGPDFLLEEDVIVVSIQYRLGALGFLNLDIESASGNMGLKDQVLALRWIKRNIKYFGGDSKRITLVGQSAGGVSVDLHKISDMSAGLFQQTISMSASPLCLNWAFQSQLDAYNNAVTLGAKLGSKFLKYFGGIGITEDISAATLAEKLGFLDKTKREFVEFLQNVDVHRIVKASEGIELVNPFKPTLDGDEKNSSQEKFLTKSAIQKYKSGNFSKGPHLMGFTSNEFLEFASKAETVAAFERLIPFPIIPSSDTLEAGVKRLSQIYFEAGIDEKQKLISSTNGAPVYYYLFDFLAPYSAHKSEGIYLLDGVAHEDELPYLFFRPHLQIPIHKHPKMERIRKILVKLWTNFVKTGNPTPDDEHDSVLGNLKWPDSRKNGAHLWIRENLQIVNERPINTFTTAAQIILYTGPKIKEKFSEVIDSIVKAQARTWDNPTPPLVS